MESNLNKGLAYQLRGMREARGWSQEEVASKADMPQTAISRLESTNYGKPTITTLKRMAKVYDVALVVRFVPFSHLVNWVSGTPYIEYGLSSDAIEVPSFEEEIENDPVFSGAPQQPAIAVQSIAGMYQPSVIGWSGCNPIYVGFSSMKIGERAGEWAHSGVNSPTHPVGVQTQLRVNITQNPHQVTTIAPDPSWAQARQTTEFNLVDVNSYHDVPPCLVADPGSTAYTIKIS